MVSHIVNAYELTNGMRYLDKAKWYIENWMDFHERTEGSINEVAWTGHCVANRLLNILYFWVYFTKNSKVDPDFERNLTEIFIEMEAILSLM
jgi:hypothetical protein